MVINRPSLDRPQTSGRFGDDREKGDGDKRGERHTNI
jgi:hypothetical protein